MTCERCDGLQRWWGHGLGVTGVARPERRTILSARAKTRQPRYVRAGTLSVGGFV